MAYNFFFTRKTKLQTSIHILHVPCIKKWETKDYLILPELEKLVVGEGKAEQEAGNLGEQK